MEKLNDQELTTKNHKKRHHLYKNMQILKNIKKGNKKSCVPVPQYSFDVSKDTQEKNNVSFCYKLSLTATVNVILSRKKIIIMHPIHIFKYKIKKIIK